MVVVSSTFSVPVEGVILETPSTKLLMNDQDLGTATLYITEHNVVWGGGVSSTGGPSPTIALQYQNISLHAVQRDPSRALYMVLNYELRLLLNDQAGSGDATSNDDDDEFDADDHPITQLRFIPPNDNDLQAMYSAMSQGQALHPDSVDMDDESPYLDGEDFDEAEEEFEDAEESNSDDAASRLQNMRLDNGNAQYEDCEDTNEQN